MLCYTNFWPKKVYFKAKIDIFLTFYVNQIFSVDGTMYKKFSFVLSI